VEGWVDQVRHLQLHCYEVQFGESQSSRIRQVFFNIAVIRPLKYPPRPG